MDPTKDGNSAEDGQALAAVFLAHAPGASAGGESAALGRKLAEMLAAARAAWPGVAAGVEGARFARHLAERLPKGLGPGPLGAPPAGADDAVAALAALHGSDLYLACACAHGAPGAIAAFEQAILTRVPAFVARLRLPPESIDEVRQLLREKLFVAPPGTPPRIADYAGHGPLASWVRIAAVRTALNLRRQRGGPEQGEGDAEEQALPAALLPELGYVKGRYQREFTEAVQAAFAVLTPEQRNVLRLHLVSGLTGDKIARLFSVNRSTVSRWLAGAREAIFLETQRLLGERLRLSPAEFASLAAVVRSQLDLSIARLLEEDPAS